MFLCLLRVIVWCTSVNTPSLVIADIGDNGHPASPYSSIITRINHIYKFGSYLKENIFRLDFKDQLAIAVEWNNRCLFYES
jgi:hypothetical protein